MCKAKEKAYWFYRNKNKINAKKSKANKFLTFKPRSLLSKA